MSKFSKINKKGFTLIELLVVIVIIGLLATLALVALNSARTLARDVKRKADLKQIRNALEMYLQDNGVYPPAGGCAYGSNCYVYSTSGNSWIPALAPYLPKQPVDPVNNLVGPWTDGHYSYSYGNVTTNGQGFDLVAQLENSGDLDRCGIKHYKFRGAIAIGSSWCFGGYSYSNQMYSTE